MARPNQLVLDRCRQKGRPPRIAYEYRAATGRAATEAPRSLIYHRYGIGAEGLVTTAKIVPPTSQNQSRIEEDLRAYLPRILTEDDRQTAKHCEVLIRSYDPCISCSTHFLKIQIDRTPRFFPIGTSARHKTLIVGLGSHHGDDRFGWLVAKSLTARLDERCDVRLAGLPASRDGSFAMRVAAGLRPEKCNAGIGLVGKSKS
jgi:hypothetical protein